MATLTVETPLQLDECGCTLETGDGGRPLFIPCRAHGVAARLAEATVMFAQKISQARPR
jgi:hypothetical protein